MKKAFLFLIFVSLFLNGGLAVLFLLMTLMQPSWGAFLLFAWNFIWFLITLDTLNRVKPELKE